MPEKYDAFLLVSFGGPEKHDDVIPFLENVLRGKNVPRERMLEVAEHYYHFDGVSPINDQCRLLLDALRTEFAANGVALPIYWGNRNWDPMLADTVRQMRDDGVKHAVALATSAFGSYSGCRQYREDLEKARATAASSKPSPTASAKHSRNCPARTSCTPPTAFRFPWRNRVRMKPNSARSAPA